MEAWRVMAQQLKAQQPNPSPQVTRLLHRIRTLVAEQRRLEGSAGRERLQANWLEIARLQRQLANIVRRELT